VLSLQLHPYNGGIKHFPVPEAGTTLGMYIAHLTEQSLTACGVGDNRKDVDREMRKLMSAGVWGLVGEKTRPDINEVDGLSLCPIL
jgi:hypothetical protein